LDSAKSEILVKRVPELRGLSDDHHTGLVLARRCRQAGRPDSTSSLEVVWAQVLEAFSSHLEPHFGIEERLLLPALDAMGEASLACRIREDHAVLRSLRDSGAPSRAVIDRFGELLDAHIRYEERQVFERVQDRLPASTLEAIAAACEANPRVCPAFSRG
jgi:hemerythrin-like domain-containing protein